MDVGGAAGQGLGEDAVDEVNDRRLLRQFAQAGGVHGTGAHGHLATGAVFQIVVQGGDDGAGREAKLHAFRKALGEALLQGGVERVDGGADHDPGQGRVVVFWLSGASPGAASGTRQITA